MLEFSHRSEEKEKSKSFHIWPYVYFHGRAEDVNRKASEEGGDAPDISIANEPLAKHYPHGATGDVAIPCVIAGEQAVVVLSSNRSRVLCGRIVFGGRIVFVSDIEAVRHAYTPYDWR